MIFDENKEEEFIKKINLTFNDKDEQFRYDARMLLQNPNDFFIQEDFKLKYPDAIITNFSLLDTPDTGSTQYPLIMHWMPKEDITVYELAQCVKYINRTVYNFEIDPDAPYLRHFEIIDLNKNK